MTMRVTFSLYDEQFAAADRSGFMVGLPLTVQLDAGAMMPEREGGTGWFERAGPGQMAIKTVGLDRCAFHGRIEQVERWQGPLGVFAQALLDCGVPVRIDLVDPEQGPEHQGTPYGLGQGDWLVGVAHLQGIVAFNPNDLLWQPVSGVIVDIQRLPLDPLNPAFGTLRWLHALPGRSFAPDQVFVTVET